MKKAEIQALSHVGNSAEANIVAADLVRNIQVFGDEIIVDVEINPAYRAKIEVDIMKAIHDRVNESQGGGKCERERTCQRHPF